MENSSKYIVFQLNDQSYGVDVHQVMSIEKMSSITEVPKTSELVKGVINHHSEVIPIIDLKERLRLGNTTYTEMTRLLIVNTHQTQFGLIVDAATDVIDINPSIVDDAPNVLGGLDRSFLKGLAKLEEGLLILLDLDYILKTEELNEVKEIISN